MKISINILCWNNKPTLEQTLKVLANEMEGIDHEIIIVDNGSRDGTADIEFGSATHIRNEKNMGISHGKNQGIDASKGDYILLLDGDIIPVANSIKLMIEYLDNNKDCHAIGMHPNKWSNQLNINMQKHHEDYCHQLVEPKVNDAACLFYGLYRRFMFDEGLRLCEEGEYGKAGYGWEDHDFFERMKKMGIAQWVIHINSPKGKYYHAINSSIRSMGHEVYMETSRKRGEAFKLQWN